MKKFSCVITEENRIHARPAGMLVKEAKNFNSKISIIKDEKTADAKGLFSIMGLGVKSGDEIVVEIEGEDEEQAFLSIKEFLSKKFCGEGEAENDSIER